MNANKKKNSAQRTIIIVSTLVALVLMVAGVFIIKNLISDDGTKRKRQIQMVSLMKPPPPPKVEEIPPEPEIKEKEEIIEQEMEEVLEEIPDDSGAEDSGPDLGLDADGVAGSDGFGLVAKKGGNSLIGGGSGGSLLKRYAWYTRIIQDQIQERLQKELEGEGGIPKGEYEATVRVVLDDIGNIITCQIVGSSGSSKMDSAINKSVKNIRADEPPPFDMPRAIKLKISSKG